MQQEPRRRPPRIQPRYGLAEPSSTGHICAPSRWRRPARTSRGRARASHASRGASPVGRSANRPSAAAASGRRQRCATGGAKPAHLNFAQHLNPEDAVHGQNASWSPGRAGAGGVGVSAPTASRSSSRWPRCKAIDSRWPEPAGSSWPGSTAPTAGRPRPNDWPARAGRDRRRRAPARTADALEVLPDLYQVSAHRLVI